MWKISTLCAPRWITNISPRCLKITYIHIWKNESIGADIQNCMSFHLESLLAGYYRVGTCCSRFFKRVAKITINAFSGKAKQYKSSILGEFCYLNFCPRISTWANVHIFITNLLVDYSDSPSKKNLTLFCR
jgi:hypothetical protein